MTKVLITGGAGFVGSHLIEHVLKNTDWDIVSLDRYDTSGNPNRLSEMLGATEGIDISRVKIVFWDLKAELNEQVQQQLGGPFDYILHLAAGSHVDRSIDEPTLFFQDNCMGTVNLLNYAKKGGLAKGATNDVNNDLDSLGKTSQYPIIGKFLYFSTDEIYGPAPMEGDFKGFVEWDRPNPNNPYAAAKAAAEMAVIAYANTYRIPCLITNTMNIFGERQHPEKFIPLVIKRSLTGEKLFIHANKDKTQAGLRHYLHARNICAATVWAVQNGQLLDGSATKGRYNIVGDIELDNLAMANLIHDIVAKYEGEHGREIPALNAELVDFHSSRPGHDLRYALDGAKLKEEGFIYPVGFEESLTKMIYWTLENKAKWL
jgi:dTDP-glucose 4,6-dehydratase